MNTPEHIQKAIDEMKALEADVRAAIAALPAEQRVLCAVLGRLCDVQSGTPGAVVEWGQDVNGEQMGDIELARENLPGLAAADPNWATIKRAFDLAEAIMEHFDAQPDPDYARGSGQGRG